jgi:hypothetical protein
MSHNRLQKEKFVPSEANSLIKFFILYTVAHHSSGYFQMDQIGRSMLELLFCNFGYAYVIIDWTDYLFFLKLLG